MLAGVCGAALSAAAAAEEGATEPKPETKSSPLEWIQDLPVPLAPAFPVADAGELCRDKPQGPAWIDRMQPRCTDPRVPLRSGLTAFLAARVLTMSTRPRTGASAVGTMWDERDHWDPSLRFRLQVELPHLSDRFSGFVGKVDADEFVTEQRDDFDTCRGSSGGRSTTKCCSVWATASLADPAAISTRRSEPRWIPDGTVRQGHVPYRPAIARAQSVALA